MKNREAQGVFKESETLYRERRYDEALTALQRLDVKYPNTRNILYPIAKCLRRLGRFDEAVAICDRLVLEFEDERAMHVRKQVERAIQRAGAQTIQVTADVTANFDDDLDAGFDPLNLGDLPPLDEEAPTVHLPGGYPAKRVQESSIPWLYIGIGAAAAVLLLIVVIAAVSSGGVEPGAEGIATVPPAEGINGATETFPGTVPPEEPIEVSSTVFLISFIGGFILGIVGALAYTAFILYLTLSVVDKLPTGSFWSDIWSATVTVVLTNLATFPIGFVVGFMAVFLPPVVGMLLQLLSIPVFVYVAYRILKWRHDFTPLDFFIYVGISFAAGVVLGGIVFVLVFLNM